MKILSPVDGNDRRRLRERLEAQLQEARGGEWRVYIVPGRYGWYARAERLRRRRGQARLARGASRA
jgi:hypothetical protein